MVKHLLFTKVLLILLYPYISNSMTMYFNNMIKPTFLSCNKIMRTLIINDKEMPSVYIKDNLHHNMNENIMKSLYSMEHIYPRSFLNKKQHNDMHNIIKTTNILNVNRSNYYYIDELYENPNWIRLNYDNYVNHRNKLFLPNQYSRGFIARAILYMTKEYDYDPNKIINKNTLAKWFFEHPPTKNEKYHNEVIGKIQGTNNIFISNYKRTSYMSRFIDTL